MNKKSTRSPGRWTGVPTLVGGLLLAVLVYFYQSPAEPEYRFSPETTDVVYENGVYSIAIEKLEVGTRVKTGNPTDEYDEEFGVDVDSSTWKKIELRAPKSDGSFALITYLRPDWWLSEKSAVVGGEIYVLVPECSIDGNATVLRIDACPPIVAGDGQVVTGKFVHHNAPLLDVLIEGSAVSIGTTASHPFWSETAQAYVEAGELHAGDTIATLDGPRNVTSVTPQPGLHTVYNLEVQVDHTYRVGELGVLVHNAENKCRTKTKNVQKGSAYNAENFGEVLGNWSRSRANPRNSAEAAADAARRAGHRGGAASELVLPSGRVYTGVSSAPYRRHELLDGVLAGCRNPGNYHGSCAEVRAIANALHAGERVEDLRGAVSRAVYIGGRYPNQTHGALRAPCQSCEDMLSFLDISW